MRTDHWLHVHNTDLAIPKLCTIERDINSKVLKCLAPLKFPTSDIRLCHLDGKYMVSSQFHATSCNTLVTTKAAEP